MEKISRNILLIAAAAIIAVVVLFSPALLFTGDDSCAETGDAPYSGTLRVLTTPDIHSHLFSMSENDTGTRIGRIGALAESLGEDRDDTLYLFAGDLGEGGFYHMYAGVPEAKSCSMAGIDAAVPGNHAFDFPTDFFSRWVTNASYPVVCANLDFTDPKLNSTVSDYTIIDAGGARVGVFGIVTPELKKFVKIPDDVIFYEDTVPIAQQAVRSLKEEGADIIIALTHQNKEEDTELAEAVSGIDLIIGGHDHQVWNETVTDKTGDETFIVHAGKYGEETDLVSLLFEDGKLSGATVERYQITEDMPDDPEITGYVMPFYKNYTEGLSEPIGYTTVPLEVSYPEIRSKETNAGDLVADTMRENIPGTDIALINSGTIRGNAVIPAGEISYLTIETILPFENIIVKLEMTGEEIKETLERSASAIVVEGDGCPADERAATGGFLQVSGIRFVIDTKEKPFCCDFDTDAIISGGKRIKNITVVTGSGTVPLDYNKTYTVAVNDYIAGGGDGYTNLAPVTGDRRYDTEVNLNNLVAAAVERNSPISPETDGRIVVL